MSAAPSVVPRARVGVRLAAGALGTVLLLTAQQYGYHRDELYFRMLPAAWGYLDQPPLTPLLARALAAIVDQPFVLRLPAIAAAVATVLVVAAIAWEVGGGRRAQALAAWGTASAMFAMSFGHVLLTSSIDMLAWVLIVACTVRATCRGDSRWWLVAGVVAGLALYNKLLVLVLLAAIAVGLLLVGPRRELRNPRLWAGVAVAVVLGAPNLVYQLVSGMPQLVVGAALGHQNGSEVRWLMWPMLLALLGPLLVPVWAAGLAGLVRRPGWRDLRFLGVAFVVVVAFTFLSGAQATYPFALLLGLLGIGSARVEPWLQRGQVRRVVVAAAVATNAVVGAVIALPVLPPSVLGQTPIPALNPLAADQIGWPRYAEQMRTAAAEAGAGLIITSNYGEAGALDRYGSGGVPVASGHNALAELTGPPEDADVVVVVGGQYPALEPLFTSCAVVDELDNGVGVDNEEQGVPVAVCTDPVASWDEIWPQVAHVD